MAELTEAISNEDRWCTYVAGDSSVPSHPSCEMTGNGNGSKSSLGLVSESSEATMVEPDKSGLSDSVMGLDRVCGDVQPKKIGRLYVHKGMPKEADCNMCSPRLLISSGGSAEPH
jgi:hypothetical protein